MQILQKFLDKFLDPNTLDPQKRILKFTKNKQDLLKLSKKEASEYIHNPHGEKKSSATKKQKRKKKKI